MKSKMCNEKRNQGYDQKDEIIKINESSIQSKVSRILTHTEENIMKTLGKDGFGNDFEAINIGYLEIKDIKNINENSAEMKNISNVKNESLNSLIDSSLLFNKIDNLIIKIDEFIEMQKETNEMQKKTNEEQNETNKVQKETNKVQKETNDLLKNYIKNQEPRYPHSCLP